MPASPIPGHLTPSPGLCGHCSHTVHRPTFKQSYTYNELNLAEIIFHKVELLGRYSRAIRKIKHGYDEYGEEGVG